MIDTLTNKRNVYGKLDLSALELKKKKKQRTEQVPDIGHTVANPFLLDVLCSVLFSSVLSWCCMHARILHYVRPYFFFFKYKLLDTRLQSESAAFFDFPKRTQPLSTNYFSLGFFFIISSLPAAINESQRSNIFAIKCNWIYLFRCVVYWCVCACKRVWHLLVSYTQTSTPIIQRRIGELADAHNNKAIIATT